MLLHSGWDAENIGDIGHTPGTLTLFERYLSSFSVTCWLRNSNAEILSLLNRRFPNVVFVEGNVNPKGIADNSPLQDAIDRTDLFVYNSGMGLQSASIEWCLNREVPFGVFGQSFTIEQIETRPSIASLLERAAFILTRESLSLSNLKQTLDITETAEFGPDGCLGIDVRDDQRADAWLYKLNLKGRKYVTVILRTNTPKHSTLSDPLNPQSPSAEEIDEDEENAAKFRMLIKHLIKLGFCVILAPEAKKEIEHMRRLLFEPLISNYKKQLFIRDSFWNVDEAASVYRQASAVFSHEPHSCMIALVNGTPAVHLYSVKHGPKYHFLKDLGLGEWLVDVNQSSAEEFCAVAESLLMNRMDSSLRLVAFHKQLETAQKRSCQVVSNILLKA